MATDLFVIINIFCAMQGFLHQLQHGKLPLVPLLLQLLLDSKIGSFVMMVRVVGYFIVVVGGYRSS